MKILHLSDLHIGANKTPDMAQRVDHLVRKLTTNRKTVLPLKNIDPKDLPIVITGDLVDHGKDSANFLRAGKAFIDPLLAAGYPLFLVPGNHDYGSGSAADSTTGAEFHRQFGKVIFGDAPANHYPVLRWINDIAMIGLNSMEDEVKDDDDGDARGRLGPPQLHSLSDILSTLDVRKAAKRVIYLHHHPFYKGLLGLSALDDSKALQDTLRGRGIDLLLFGHKHEGRSWHGEIGIHKVYDGGTSTGHKKNLPPESSADLPPHRLIDLQTDQAAQDVNLGLLADYRVAD